MESKYNTIFRINIAPCTCTQLHNIRFTLWLLISWSLSGSINHTVCYNRYLSKWKGSSYSVAYPTETLPAHLLKCGRFTIFQVCHKKYSGAQMNIEKGFACYNDSSCSYQPESSFLCNFSIQWRGTKSIVLLHGGSQDFRYSESCRGVGEMRKSLFSSFLLH